MFRSLLLQPVRSSDLAALPPQRKQEILCRDSLRVSHSAMFLPLLLLPILLLLIQGLDNL
jgi:hypothetical protein